jgi:pimeloyl-ACP methyl ester carboxylesterase
VTGTLLIEQPDLLADEPVQFSVVGCSPGEAVTITAAWTVGDEPVRSEARFAAASTGIVEPGRHASIGGSYTGVEPHGLWWSIGLSDSDLATETLDPWTVSLTAAGATWESSGSLVRRKAALSVRQLEVTSGRLRGIAFIPDGQGPFPSVLLFSGSGGGLASVQCQAALLASRGFATLALAYFNYADLPAELVDIPLEYFRDGMDWLIANAPAAGGRLAVMGTSRGGELALLLGSSYPERVAAVVAKVPSGVVWGGLTKDDDLDCCAWTRDGRPIRPLTGDVIPLEALPRRDGAIELTPSFEAVLAAAPPEELTAAEIPVERCGGPVLMLSGEDDAMWPSVAMSEIAVRRAERHGMRYAARHLRYPDAGHHCASPAGFPASLASVHPVTGGLFAYGGTVVGNAHASASSWRETIEFLSASLSGDGWPPG